MNESMFFKMRLYATGIVTIGIWSLLCWNYFHGGVPSHHILARKDLPEISNIWGGVLLPLLTWFLVYRIQRRLVRNRDQKSGINTGTISVIYGFSIALIYGALLATSFTLGYSDVTGYLFVGLFIIGPFLPIYRAECLLGFVIGMTYTFGAILPTGIGTIIIVIGAISYLLLRRGIIYLYSRLTNR